MRKSGIIYILPFFTLSLLFLLGCSDDNLQNSSYAKVYIFWHRPAFNLSGYELFVLSNYSSSHFDSRLNYKIVQKTVDNTSKVIAPSLIKIDNKSKSEVKLKKYRIFRIKEKIQSWLHEDTVGQCSFPVKIGNNDNEKNLRYTSVLCCYS